MPFSLYKSPTLRPKNLFGGRALLAHEESDTCAYCGATLATQRRAEPTVCACGAHNSGVSARERRQQQLAG